MVASHKECVLLLIAGVGEPLVTVVKVVKMDWQVDSEEAIREDLVSPESVTCHDGMGPVPIVHMVVDSFHHHLVVAQPFIYLLLVFAEAA